MADAEEDSINRIERTESRMSRAISNISKRITGPKANTAGVRQELLPLTNLDEGTVGWDSQDDPAMPLNFPTWKKWMLVALLSAITLVTPFASSILSPGIASLSVEFGVTNDIVASLTVSIYLLGYVVGPLFLAPLSEIYGRKIILGASNVFFCAWQIGCALAPNVEALIVFRFLCGVGGAGCLTLGGGVIGDLFRPEQRGFAMGIWVLGPLFGPTLGPLIGGFLAQTIGWRWDFWIVLMVGAPITIRIEFLNQETSHKVLIERKVARLAKELGRDDLHSCYDNREVAKKSKSRILLDGLVRPTKMLLFSPIVLVLSLYIAFLYGLLYLLFTTIPTVFMETYGFSVGVSGLVYVALGIANIIGWVVVQMTSDKTVVRLSRANDGVFVPEMRLTTSIPFGFILPATFFWYGWATEYKTHWIVPILGLTPFSYGIVGIFLPITTYLVDSYPMYAASAIAANTVLRSLVGALLPLAGPPMYQSLGLGWGNTLLGFLCVLMMPLPVVFNRFGARLRKAQKFTL
jgi:multidrug resistance protein